MTVAFRATGGSTAVAANVSYRLSKLEQLHPIRGRWLDCGCSDGGYTEDLLRRGAGTVIGTDVDVVELSHRVSSARSDRSGHYGCAMAEDLPFPEAVFDGVLLNEVLEHVVNDEHCLSELFRVLRPGGALVLMSPNRCFPIETHGMTVAGFNVLKPIPLLPWLPAALGSRVMRARNYWPGQLRELVRKAGFEIQVQSSVLPVFEVFPLLPASVARAYRRRIPALERLPLIRFASVSTFLLAVKPTEKY